MFKRVFSLGLVVMLTISLVACGGGGSGSGAKSKKNVQDHFYYYLTMDGEIDGRVCVQVHLSNNEVLENGNKIKFTFGNQDILLTEGFEKKLEYKTQDIVEKTDGVFYDNRNGINSSEDGGAALEGNCFYNKVNSLIPDEIKNYIIVDKIIIDDEICLDSTSMMFYKLGDVTEFYGLEKLDMSNNHNMMGMFGDCESLQTLDLSSWNVSKVTDMSRMFDGCWRLEKLDLSNWNVSKVTNMSNMFDDDCEPSIIPSWYKE